MYIFSWWGFVMAILRALNISPVSPLLILILNSLGTLAFLLLKKNIGLSVSLFVLATHVIPVYIFRKDTIDVMGSLAVFASYLLFLKYMGTSVQEVYSRILEEPMPTIGSYISSRF